MPAKPVEATPLQTTKRLLKDDLLPRWKLYALNVVFMVGVSVFTGLLAWSTKRIVNDVFVSENVSEAWIVAALVIGISVAKSFFQYGNAVIQTVMNRQIAAQNQRKLFENILYRDVDFFAGLHPAKHMQRVMMFGKSCGSVVVSIGNKLVTDILTLLALVVVMVRQDATMSLICLILFPLIFFMVGRLIKSVRKHSKHETELLQALASTGVESIEGIRTVKSYSLEEKSAARFGRVVEDLEKRVVRIAKATNATVPLMELLGGIVIGLFVMYASWQTITNGKTPGEFTAFITAFLLAYQPAERVSKTLVDIQKGLVHVGMMHDMIDTPQAATRTGTLGLENVTPSIAFEDVSFYYADDAPALHDVDLQIKAGERIAIVGRSGAGKTTFIDLCQRFYDPTDGTVRLGDLDLKDVSPDALRDGIALISQDVFLFDGSIRDNILDGHATATEQQVQDAVRRAALDNVLDKLQGGLEARVGPNGSNLSGGQKQRVGIARALVKQAKVYIFDEATSALDGENDRAVMEAVVQGAKDSTMLFVTHRPSTLEWVDRVLVLDHGRVAGFDTHEALMAENALYRSLFNLEMDQP
ncbi:ABC transporter ATP-binding protein [Donghicola eburneus]|uniref:Putative ABC-type multidrug transport system, ATPase and permease component n=1 Tax=Donghicola eburneus TaxID=393278 RepID=A0A1M4N386_9RHOB|nr:ABC transporter ATP-binding protein [Donghicola eburneus]SCM68464.1 putative ABC-type multidrug transport system, ATPase and permease component [Donghicola eburneus]SFQ24946.1 ATP-binding cassette, subfamily B [Donghicola eburneus]